jgi:hypothetical protein
MRELLRLATLLLFCGVIALSVPLAASTGEGAESDGAQQVALPGDQVGEASDIVGMIWTAVRVQFGSWFGITTPSVPTTPQAEPGDPVKSQTDPRKNPALDVYLDTGGAGAEE